MSKKRERDEDDKNISNKKQTIELDDNSLQLAKDLSLKYKFSLNITPPSNLPSTKSEKLSVNSSKSQNNTVVDVFSSEPPKKSAKKSTKKKSATESTNMRNIHGKVFETYILATVYGAEPDKCDTAKHDLHGSKNKENPGYNVSIKTTKSQTVHCSSVFNIMKSVENDSPVDLVVVKYKDIGDTKKVTSVSRYDLKSLGPEVFGATKENWEEFKEDMESLQEAVGQKYNPANKKQQRKEINDLKKKIAAKYSDSIYTINHKVPGQGRPGRVQASLSKGALQKLADQGRLIESNEGSILHGKTFTDTFKKGDTGKGVKTRKTRKDKKSNKNVIFLNKKGLSKDTIEKVNLILRYL
jgi:hypothetical protein